MNSRAIRAQLHKCGIKIAGPRSPPGELQTLRIPELRTADLVADVCIEPVFMALLYRRCSRPLDSLCPQSDIPGEVAHSDQSQWRKPCLRGPSDRKGSPHPDRKCRQSHDALPVHSALSSPRDRCLNTLIIIMTAICGNLEAYHDGSDSLQPFRGAVSTAPQLGF